LVLQLVVRERYIQISIFPAFRSFLIEPNVVERRVYEKRDQHPKVIIYVSNIWQKILPFLDHLVVQQPSKSYRHSPKQDLSRPIDQQESPVTQIEKQTSCKVIEDHQPNVTNVLIKSQNVKDARHNNNVGDRPEYAEQ
jgi:hypothetical protein